MRVLVTGANGQLGRAMIGLTRDGTEFIGTARQDCEISRNGIFHLDITNHSEVISSISKFSPDVVVNAAALTGVDLCERNPALAEDVNARGAASIALACSLIGCKMVQVSTDYVFDGERGGYSEGDSVNPIQEYGRTKLMGEKLADEILEGDLTIVRTSVIFDGVSNNFVTWVLNGLRGESEIKLVEDQWVSPTSSNFLASSILSVIETGISGIINIASSKGLSRVEMGQIIAEKFNLDGGKIAISSMADLGWGASRPRNSTLNCSKFSTIGHLISFKEMLEIEFSN